MGRWNEQNIWNHLDWNLLQTSKTQIFWTSHANATNKTPKIMLHGEVDLGKRKIGRPKKSYLQSVRDDLKLFNLWNSYQKNGQFQKESAENRLLWRRQINKAAQDFQAKWENNRTQCRKNQIWVSRLFHKFKLSLHLNIIVCLLPTNGWMAKSK